jgi:hypothetical protein
MLAPYSSQTYQSEYPAKGALPMKILSHARHAIWSVPFICSSATAISWDYADLAYVADGKSYSFMSNDRVYLSGTSLDAAFSLHDHVHVRTMARAWNGRLALPPPDGYVNVALNDWHSGGIGVSYPFSAGGIDFSGWAEVSLDNYFTSSIVSSGFGYAVGVRSHWLDSYELGVWFREAKTGLAGSNVDIDPRAYGLDFLYSLSPRSALRLGWSNGELRLSGGGGSIDYDVSHTEIGFRYLFDPARSRAPETLERLGYNAVYVAYAFEGDISVNGSSQSLDLDEGISLGFRLSPRKHLFIGAQYDGRGFKSDGMGPGTISLANHLAIGPGGYYTLHQGDLSYSGYAQLTYNRVASVEGLVLQGYGGKIGAKAGYRSLLEGHVYGLAGKICDRLGGDTWTIDPRGFGVEVAVSPFNNGLAFTLGYEDVTFDAKLSSSSVDIKTEQWLLGVRQQF